VVHGGEVVAVSNYWTARRRQQVGKHGDIVTGNENCSNRRRPCASRAVSRDEMGYRGGFR